MAKVQIGNVTLETRYFWHQWQGVTDLPFRLLCREMGTGPRMQRNGERQKPYIIKTRIRKAFLEIHEKERPVSLQLFGSDPELMAEMAKELKKGLFPFWISIWGPVPKVVNNGEGSALMKDPLLAEKLFRPWPKAIHKPVTVKIRKGFDDSCVNAVEIARIAQESGAAAVAVHGRTKRAVLRRTSGLGHHCPGKGGGKHTGNRKR